MSVTGKSLGDLAQVNTDFQSGDLLYVERAGVPDKRTWAQLLSGVSGQTLASLTITSATLTTADINGGTIDGTVIGGATPAAGSFTSISGTTRIDMASVSPRLVLRETDGNFDFNTTQIIGEGSQFRIDTLQNDFDFVSSDYVMTRNSSGATQHSFRIQGTERLLIGASSMLIAGSVLPVGTQAIGGIGSGRWDIIYLVNAPNVSSDARLKDNIADLTEAERRAAARIKTRTFTMKETGQKKVGYIAQEVIAAMAAEGLDAFEYGLVSDGETYGVDMDAINAFRLG